MLSNVKNSINDLQLTILQDFLNFGCGNTQGIPGNRK